jgi:transketolase
MSTKLVDPRNGFSKALVELGKENASIIVLVNDSKGSSKVGPFADNFPERFYNIGIAEQDMIGIAAGLATCGKIPFACGAACFLSARSCEQVKIDVAYSNLNVKIVGVSGGLSYGPLGPSHHSVEDIAIMRAFGNITVIVPADAVEAEQAAKEMVRYRGPVYMRLGRHPLPIICPPDYRFKIGKAVTLKQGRDAAIIAIGSMAARALEAAEQLSGQGINVSVFNMPTIKPIDRDAIVRAAKETGKIVTVEEHTISGGLGSAVAEVLVEEAPVPMRRLGIPGIFSAPGPTDALFEKYGLTSSGIVKAIKELL